MSLPLIPLVPALGAVLVLAFRRQKGTVGPLAIASLVLTLGLAATAVWLGTPEATLRWRDDMFTGLNLDGFGRVMAVLVPLIAIPVATYASAAEGEDGGPRLLAWILGFVSAMEILVLAGDFLTLLIGWELVGACSWGLIGYRWRESDRPRAAAQAFLTTRFGDLGLYLAAAAAFSATGSLEFEALGGLEGPYLHVVGAGILLAAAAKSGQLPFSPWLFSAMSGPTPASALLHSATMVAAGAYALIRLWPWLDPLPWIGPVTIAVGVLTTLAGGVVALLHTDIKKALAGSTSSQYGLMFLAVGAGSPAAAGAQLLTHATFKSLLFLGAGAAIHAVGTGRLDSMRLGRAMPGTAGLVAIGALGLAAVPPMGGAFSKESVLAAAVHASPGLGVLVLISGLLTAFYAGRLLLMSYGPGNPATAVKQPRRAEFLGIAVGATLTLLLSVLWLPRGPDLLQGALSVGPMPESQPWELPVSVALLGVAGLTCFLLWRREALFALGLPPRMRERLASWFGLPAAAHVLVARPTLVLARVLARFDDRVVDAGVRGAAAFGRFVSGLLALWGERGVDGLVEGAVSLTNSGARASMALDDRGIDGTVEGIARVTGWAGARSRRLQSGLTHHYYAVALAGLMVLVVAAILWS